MDCDFNSIYPFLISYHQFLPTIGSEMRSPSRHQKSHQKNPKRFRQFKTEPGRISQLERIKKEPVECLMEDIEDEEEEEEQRYYESDNVLINEERLRANQLILRRYEKIIADQKSHIQKLSANKSRVKVLVNKMTSNYERRLRDSEEKLEQSRRNALDDDLLIGKYLRKIEKYEQKLKQVRHVEIKDSLICKFIQACEDLDLEKIRSCLKLRVDVNGRSYQTVRRSGAAVFALVESNSVTAGATLSLLIEKHLEVNMRDELGNTPLIKATSLANVPAVKILCRAPGVDVNLSNQLDNTALIQAVRGNNLELVSFFRDHVPTMDWNKNSPVVDAVQEGNVEILQIFLQVPGLRLTNLSGSDSSLSAVAVKSVEGDPAGCIRLLSQDPRLSWNEPCLDNGESPLSFALQQRRREIVKILLEVPNIDPSSITAPRHIEVMRSVMCEAVAQLNRRLSQVPECPVCLRIFRADRTVFQCEAGHFVCQDCFQHPTIQGQCTVCRRQMMGRAHGFEHFLQQLF